MVVIAVVILFKRFVQFSVGYKPSTIVLSQSQYGNLIIGAFHHYTPVRQIPMNYVYSVILLHKYLKHSFTVTVR